MSLNPISEPTGVYPESEFERSLAPLIERALHGCRAVVVLKFGLDIAVFLEDVGPPQPLFVEVKSYGGKRQGGVGFGNGRGEGPQVDLLVGDASALFDSYIRWAFVDATQPVGTDRYAFLTCSDARAAVMRVVARGKQNNFKLAALGPHFVGWRAFSEQFLEFFASARGRR